MLSKNLSLNSGETALLFCVGFGEPDVEVNWMFNGAPVANTSLTPIFEENIIQGSRPYKQSFLQLCSVTTSSAGSYTCSASNGQTTSNAITQLSVISELKCALRYVHANLASEHFRSKSSTC